jgi:hypothetical protein
MGNGATGAPEFRHARQSREPRLRGGDGQGRGAGLERPGAVRRRRTGFTRKRDWGLVRDYWIGQRCRNDRFLRLRIRLGAHRSAPDIRLDELRDIAGRPGRGRRVQGRCAIGLIAGWPADSPIGRHQHLQNERGRNQPEASRTYLPLGDPMPWKYHGQRQSLQLRRLTLATWLMRRKALSGISTFETAGSLRLGV